jgi:hypothetical protein
LTFGAAKHDGRNAIAHLVGYLGKSVAKLCDVPFHDRSAFSGHAIESSGELLFQGHGGLLFHRMKNL